MAQLIELLGKEQIKLVEKAKNKSPETSIGRELMNNLMYRIQRRGNVMVEMNGHYIDRVRLNLSSNFFEPTEKNYQIWVKPFIVKGKFLMFNHNGVVIRASDVFGSGINRVTL